MELKTSASADQSVATPKATAVAEVMPILSEINIQPIKSCGQIDVSSGWMFSPYGLAFDKYWMVARESDGLFISQRSHPQMALIRTWFDDLQNPRWLFIGIPGIVPIRLSIHATLGPRRLVRVHKDKNIIAVDMGDKCAKAFGNYLGLDVRFVRIAPESDRRTSTGAQIAFHDGKPLLMISKSALDPLNRHLREPVTMDAFRPQLIIDGCCANAEDRFAKARIGSVILTGQNLCIRCQVPDVRPENGTRREGRPVYKVLEEYRYGTKPDGDKGVFFGRNMTFEIPDGSSGHIRAGLPVEVLAEDNLPEIYNLRRKSE